MGLTISLELEITIDGITTKSSIRGAYNDWKMKKNNKNLSNIDNLEYYQNAERILSGIRNKMRYF